MSSFTGGNVTVDKELPEPKGEEKPTPCKKQERDVCTCGIANGKHASGYAMMDCDVHSRETSTSAKGEWWEKEPYKCIHRNPYTGDALNVHWDIPAIISKAQEMERARTLELVREIVGTANSNACGFTCDCGESHAGNVMADIVARLIKLDSLAAKE